MPLAENFEPADMVGMTVRNEYIYSVRVTAEYIQAFFGTQRRYAEIYENIGRAVRNVTAITFRPGRERTKFQAHTDIIQ